ncbi:hypothetical protein [Nocardia jejuensis]|uniref:hypothetical protein n=1 Tax=Nocardia jejuensis TaxID=328049 RepID=UPI000832EB17|nr:hypothetical protein [Nocardia jejuensis]
MSKVYDGRDYLPATAQSESPGSRLEVLSPVVWVGGAIAWEVVEWARVRTLSPGSARTSN